MWESPIKQILEEMHTKMEGECMKVVQKYGFDVDKEELTKALMYDRQQYEKGYAEGYEAAKQWIPCSERLPELETDVLICNEYGGIVIASLTKPDIFWEDAEGNYILYVIAWMPLPEPYKEGGAV